MTELEWNQLDFRKFINQFGKETVIETAPILLYSKKDKEHEAYNSLIAFFFITGGLFIYIALSYFLAYLFLNIVLFTIILIIGTIADVILITNVIKSNVYIKPLECWVEIHKRKLQNDVEYYCITYYPIFTGKCFPNEAKNVIFKLIQDQIYGSTIDISQLEIYFKLDQQVHNLLEPIGFFFQYSEGKSFREENIDRDTWKFFPFEKVKNDNFIAVGNWDHQFEWRDDLEYDFDKLHEYAPWVIHRCDETNLKPLTQDFKQKIHWKLRFIDSTPKLKPWEENFETQTYKNPNAYNDIELINMAITKIISGDKKIENLKDIKDDLFTFKAYFRDLKL